MSKIICFNVCAQALDSRSPQQGADRLEYEEDQQLIADLLPVEVQAG